jgi:hypothetical protein
VLLIEGSERPGEAAGIEQQSETQASAWADASPLIETHTDAYRLKGLKVCLRSLETAVARVLIGDIDTLRFPQAYCRPSHRPCAFPTSARCFPSTVPAYHQLAAPFDQMPCPAPPSPLGPQIQNIEGATHSASFASGVTLARIVDKRTAPRSCGLGYPTPTLLALRYFLSPRRRCVATLHKQSSGRSALSGSRGSFDTLAANRITSAATFSP